jgi:purine-nucleoside phosphorylase
MLYDQIQEAVASLRKKTNFSPAVGLVLGTGLSGIADDVEVVAEFPYAEIPHFPTSTVQSHRGKLIFGHLAGVAVAAMAGRFHYYEGYSARQITFPIRALKFLGIKQLILSNAAGSVNPDMESGDLVFIRDHINIQPDNPLRGENDERLGPRFPDMLYTYDRELNSRALRIAQNRGIRAHEGVYLALQGPNLETPAEYQAFHRWGADVVGMSTVPEVLVARHMDLPVFVVSVVTNKCYPPEEIKPTTVEDVIAAAGRAEKRLRDIILDLVGIWS